MKAVYLLGSGLPTTDGCKKKIYGAIIGNDEKMFQTDMLKGNLPNGESIAGAQASRLFYEKIYLDFPNDPGHFDHFHLELQ